MKRKQLAVEDVMSTAVITLKETDTIGRAQLEMHLANIRHVPVVDQHNQVVGIISNRDLIRVIAAREQFQLPVHDIMTRTVRTIHWQAPAHEAAAILMDNKIGALPVISDQLQLVGIVTETDFLAVAHDALRGVRIGTRRRAA